MIYISLFIFLVVLQFMAPILAKKVKNRFLQLGITMKSDPSTSWLNVTTFWKEAHSLNVSTKDFLITKYLWIYKGWWCLIIGSAVALFFGLGLN
ncbi:hypothetical protein [Thalassomonas sp. RHCl1]|uniref:hypothetical protein n=1 Tax=Thalassomonas sp. RHCl1 TaxID=2995320 RepID=UPI00248BAFA1|nr:hypothetical protein [Thalassomonas sp. RHCl1]